MKLFLASEARNPFSIDQLEQFVSGLAGKSIVFIPTAANAESGWEDWKTHETWNVIQQLGAKVDVVQLEQYTGSEKQQSLREILEGSDIIWVGGGFAGYLMYWLRVTGVSNYIAELLETGIVYVGSSAGSMITHPSLATAEWDFMGLEEWGDAETGAAVIPGLNLVNFNFLPHYQDNLKDQINEHFQKEATMAEKLYLVKNDEVITISDEELKFLSPDSSIDSKIGRFLQKSSKF